MELPEAMGGLAGQEDLKLPLTTVHSVHQEAAQLGRKDVGDRDKGGKLHLELILPNWYLFSWRSEVQFRLRVERGNKILLVHCEAVGGKDLDQWRGHVVCRHPVCLRGVHLLVIFHVDK